MNREDIIRWAREAGGSDSDPSDLLTVGILERFAELVAAAERELCAMQCDIVQNNLDEHTEEGCYECGWEQAAGECADAIRARSEE